MENDPHVPVVPARPISLGPPPFPATAPHPLELRELSYRAAGLDLLLVVLATLVVPLGFQFTLALVNQLRGQGEPGAVSPEEIDLLTIQKWFDAVLACGLMLYFILRYNLPPARFGLRNQGAGKQFLWGLANLGAIYAWMLVTIVFVGLAVVVHPELEKNLLERTELLKSLPVYDPKRTFLLLVPVAIHEEVVFRALLLPYLHRLLGRWWLAIGFSSLVFAVLHFEQGLIGVLQILGVGLALAVFFVASRSLFAVILAHFLFDLVQFQLVRLLPI